MEGPGGAGGEGVGVDEIEIMRQVRDKNKLKYQVAAYEDIL